MSRAHFPRTSRRRTIALAVLACALLSQGAALATTNQPKLTETYPEFGFAVQTQYAHQISAKYDRPLDTMRSGFRLEDRTGAPLAGSTMFLADPKDTDDLKVIAFKPAADLTEADSPYTAFTWACPAGAGDCAADAWPFKIDNTAPAIPTMSQPSNGDVRREQRVDVRGTSEPGARIVAIENETQIASGPVLQDGTYSVQLPYPDEDGVQHTVALHAVDEAVNVSDPTPSVTFVHDDVTVNPFITLPLKDAQVNSNAVTIGGTAKPSTSVYVYEGSTLLGTTPSDAKGKFSGPFTFAEGPHSVRAFSWDGATSDGPSNTRDFVVDTIAPGAPVITVPAAGAKVGTQDVVVSGTAEGFSTVIVRESTQSVVGTGVTTAGGDWSATVHLTEGAHTIAATAKDRAGNESIASGARTFTVDTIAPATAVFTSPEAGAQLGTSSVTITGRAEADSTVRILEHATLVAIATTNSSGDFSVVSSFQDGLHSITGVAVDGAGNAGPSSDVLSFTIDTVAPALPVIYSPPQDGQYTTQDVFVAGSGESNIRIAIYEGATLLRMTGCDRNGNWSTTIHFANGNHTITAQAIDLAGNIGPMTAARDFLVGATNDTTPPPAPIIDTPLQASVVAGFVTFTGEAEGGSTVKVYEGAQLLVSGTASQGGAFDIGTTMESGSHNMRATATDIAGNTSIFSDIRSFKVDANRPTVTIDTANLTIFVPISGITITGTASDDYGVARIEIDYVNKITNNTDLTRDADVCSGCPNAPVTWTATPALLGPGIYDVNAYAIDLVGNRSKVDTIVIIVI